MDKIKQVVKLLEIMIQEDVIKKLESKYPKHTFKFTQDITSDLLLKYKLWIDDKEATITFLPELQQDLLAYHGIEAAESLYIMFEQAVDEFINKKK